MGRVWHIFEDGNLRKFGPLLFSSDFRPILWNLEGKNLPLPVWSSFLVNMLPDHLNKLDLYVDYCTGDNGHGSPLPARYGHQYTCSNQYFPASFVLRTAILEIGGPIYFESFATGKNFWLEFYLLHTPRQCVREAATIPGWGLGRELFLKANSYVTPIFFNAIWDEHRSRLSSVACLLASS